MINITDIRTSFYASIVTFETTCKVPIFSASSISHFNQKIYSWMALNDLIQVLKQEIPDSFDEENDLLERFTIRFVVDKNMRIWFAREGECTSSIPAHSDMIADENVYTAGNFVFSKDYTTIIEITNKSGHYLPPFGSLVFFVSLLLGLENNPDFPVRIAEEIQLVSYQKQTDFNPVAISRCTLSRKQLFPCIPIDNRIKTTGDYPFIKLRKRDGVYFMGADSSITCSASNDENDISLTDSTGSINSGSMYGLGDFLPLSTTPVRATTKRIYDGSIKTESPLRIGSFFSLDSPKEGVTSLLSSSHGFLTNQLPRKTSKKDEFEGSAQRFEI